MRKYSNNNDTKNQIEELAKKFSSNQPNVTNYNNAKTRKYFSSRYDDNNLNVATLKDTLVHNVNQGNINQNNIVTPSNNNQSKITFESISTMGNRGGIPNIPSNFNNQNSHKRAPSNILKVSKEIFKFSEKNFTKKNFYKIPAKFEEKELYFDESDEEELNEQIPQNFKQNKTCDNVKTKKKEKKQQAEESLLVVKEKLNTTDIDLLKSNFNQESIIQIESLYTLIIKELENKSRNIDSLIINFFTILENNYDIYNLEFSFSDKNFQKMIKSYFCYEIFILCFLTIKTILFNDQIFTALRTCFFHLHQNCIIVMLLVQMRSNEDNEKVKNKIEENKIWLNKNNYKKYLANNNKIIVNIVKNIIAHLRDLDVHKNEMEVIVNNLKNIGKLKIEVIRDSIYKQFVREKIDNYTKYVENNEKEKDLETEIENLSHNIPKPPFLPELKERLYTLVLDLDETLVHYVEDQDSAYIQIRPGAENFLEEMNNYFEIVIFTAAMQDVKLLFINILLVC